MPTSVANYIITGNEESRQRAFVAASHLAGRLHPTGYIRVWNGHERTGWAIIDSMMDLEILYWASRGA